MHDKATLASVNSNLTAVSSGQRGSPHSGLGRRRGLLSAALVVLGLLAITATPVLAAYTLRDSDGISTVTNYSRVAVSGSINWYGEGFYVKGYYTSDTVVKLNKDGCLWVKIDWNKVNANVSWPPSGTAYRTGDGWYRRCGSAGLAVNLGGVTHTSSALWASTICIGFSQTWEPALRRYDACERNDFLGA